MSRRLGLAALALLLALGAFIARPSAQLSGVSLPATCTAGATFSFTAYTPALTLLCLPANVWTPIALQSGTYTMADAGVVNLFAVTVPTANTGCSVYTISVYTVTNGTTQAATHTSEVLWSFVNENGTVTADATEVGESTIGTGCGAGCDAWTIGIVSTTATARGAFNNSLSATGSLIYRILNNTCPTLTLS